MAEALMALAIIIVVVGIAVPLVRGAYAGDASALTSAEQIARDLRRARMLAIMNGATSPQGYAIDVTSASGSRLYGYRTVNLGDLTVVPPDRACAAGSAGLKWESPANVRRVEFSPVGSAVVYDDADQPITVDPLVTVSAADEAYQVRITPATGFVEVQRVP